MNLEEPIEIPIKDTLHDIKKRIKVVTNYISTAPVTLYFELVCR